MLTGDTRLSDDSLQDRLARNRLLVLAQLMDEMERTDTADDIVTAMQDW